MTTAIKRLRQLVNASQPDIIAIRSTLTTLRNQAQEADRLQVVQALDELISFTSNEDFIEHMRGGALDSIEKYIDWTTYV